MFRGGFRGGSGGGGGSTPPMSWASITSTDSPYSSWGAANSVEVDVSGGAVTVVLPAAASNGGKVFTVNHKAGGIGTNPITIQTAGSDLINGLSQIVATQENITIRASSNGSAWIVI